MWQPPSAGTVATHLGVGQSFLPGQAAQGPGLRWRLLHGSLMCGAYIGRAVPAQAYCPFSCCIDPSQPQTISHMFITCPVSVTVTEWLCRLWLAMTGYLPVVSVASLLAADTSSEQLPSDALFQTWHRLRLAVLHSIWAASQMSTAGIISLLTHICIPVALNIDVHPKLTHQQQSPYHQGLHTQLCNPSCSDSCKP